MKGLKEKIIDVFSPPPRFADNDEIDVSPETVERHGYLGSEPVYAEAPHAEVGELQTLKNAVKGHGEQTVLPDECQYGDNDLCYVEA